MKRLAFASTSLSALAALSAGLTSGAAYAQPAASQAGAATEFTEVVVTAGKREERLINVPESVTAVSAADLAKIGAVQFRDYANTIPGLNFSTAGAGESEVNIRGVTTGTNVSSTVGLYVDEVPYGSSGSFAKTAQLALDVGLFDVDRVEVLRGPQGTLYGAGAMGGLIKYVSKTPQTQAFGADAQAGVSDTNGGGINYNGAVDLNVPLVTDKAAVRVSGFYSRDGGYIDNTTRHVDDVNRSDVSGARADVLLTPTDKLSIRLAGFIQDITRDGRTNADYALNGQPINGSLNQSAASPEPFSQHFDLVSATVGYDLGFSKLTSVTSYQSVQSHYSVDYPSYIGLISFFMSPVSTAGLGISEHTNRFVQEVRLASSGASPLQWIAGVYYDSETSDNFQKFFERDLSGNPVSTNFATVQFPSDYKEIAGFGDLTYHFTDKLEATGGVRYARNDQTFAQNASGTLTSIGLLTPEPAQKSSDQSATYLATASYHFSPDATGYIRYATGYRPGGPNFKVTDSSGNLLAPLSFKPDSLDSYEIGFKAETSDRRYSIDASTYYIHWSQIQLYTSVAGLSITGNANGAADIKGAELALTARPVQALGLVGSFAYEDPTLTSDTPELGASKGERLPNVPKFTATLSGDYEFSPSDLRPSVGLTVRYVSDRTASYNGAAAEGIPQYILPEYTSVDLRGSVHLGQTIAQVYVRNLFDERGQLSASSLAASATTPTTPGLPVRVAVMQPRTIGISVKTHF
jgi:outer membrane receptor protein involved in Fe transport